MEYAAGTASAGGGGQQRFVAGSAGAAPTGAAELQ